MVSKDEDADSRALNMKDVTLKTIFWVGCLSPSVSELENV